MAKIRLRLPGTLSHSPARVGLSRVGGLVDAEVRAHCDVSAARRDGSRDDGFITDAEEHDVIQLQWESGIIELVRVGDLTSKFGDAVRSATGELAIPQFRVLRNAARGESTLPLDAVQHIAVKVSEKVFGSLGEQVSELLLPPVIRKIESERVPDPGLYRLDRDGALLGRATPEPLGGRPLLVLVHGTFSTSMDAFKELYRSQEWVELYKRYDAGCVLALEHRTVTESPVENALQLLGDLPRGARLHLLSHSRGGLVGDLLCRSRWTPEEVDASFEGEQYAAMRAQLKKLAELLFAADGQRVHTVERFLRVAAPAAGTQLAGRRLDQFFNVALTLLGKLIDAGVGWFDFVKSLAVQALATRTNAAVCPGLEVMMPESPFTRFLNIGAEEGGDLAVISGDVSGGRWYELVKQVFVDFYFRRKQNDFVVDTASMTRGAPRTSALQYHYDGPNADHFSYFQDKGIRTRALTFLADGSDAGFEALSRSTEGIPTRGLSSFAGFDAAKLELRPRRPELPTVFILPGIMGTLLGPADRVLWLKIAQMARGGLQRLLFNTQNPIVTHGLIEGYYERLAERVAEHFNVELHGFDWRDSIKVSSASLAAVIAQALARTTQPVCILAHSMGGLVSRGLITWHRSTWDELTRRGGRLIMLGTPNYGSYVPAQAFTEQHKLISWLDVVDRSSTKAQLTEVIRDFPGMVEMLPRGHNADGTRVDLLDEQSWSHLPAFSPSAAALGAARAVRDELDVVPDSEKQHLVYVAGHDDRTPARMESTRNHVRFLDGTEGDGTVPWSLGRIDGVTTYFANASHGDLPAHTASFAAYIELLKSGRTQGLSRVAPGSRTRVAQSSTSSGIVLAPSETAVPLNYFPSAQDLLAAAMGSNATEAEEGEAPLAISIVNAHVHTAKHPIIVGHYEGDPITSVEAVLDRWLDGQLSRDHALRIYPGALGTSRWYRRKNDANRGVIVMGLGQLGSLTRPRLTDTLREGLLRYAADQFQLTDGKSPLDLALTSLLVGSWGTLSVEDSVCSVIAAVRQSNARLLREPLRPVRFIKLELMELFRDVATQAGHVLQRLIETVSSPGASRQNLHIDPRVVDRDTVRRSRPASHVGYYNRIAITAKYATREQAQHSTSPTSSLAPRSPEALSYDVATQLARTDSRERPIQWQHIEKLLERAPQGDNRAADVLFQYLLPLELQTDARDAADLVLELDDWTAQIPWELFSSDDGESDGLVRRGILRTLRTDRPRRVTGSMSRRALVIGEPAKVLPPLPGALGEAIDVGQALDASGMRARVLQNPSADECFRALLEERWDIVHIAAHGHFDADDPRRSGVVLGDGRFLTASEFENMKATPAIVFLNCCHLGRLHLAQPGPWAASLAKELIRIGVSVVVVAGWAVSDHAAVTFARTFYRELFDGQPLMSAMREARRLTRGETNGIDVTWGAYQVYGSPGFTLPDWARPVTAFDGVDPSRWVSPHEFVEYVLDLQVPARDDHEKPGGTLHRHLDRLLSDIPAEWRARGDVNAAFGRVYGAMSSFERAIECYLKAAKSSDADLRVIEQLANYEAREATRLLREGRAPLDPAVVDKAKAHFISSRRRIEQLLLLGETAERYALLGATLRRSAVFEAELGESGLKQRAYEAYAKACELEPQSNDAHYHALLSQSMQLMMDPGRVDLGVLQAARVTAEQAGPTNLWAVITSIELGLLEEIATAIAANPEAPPDVGVVTRFANSLREAWAAVAATESERKSSLESLSTQLALATAPSVRAWFQALCDQFSK